MNGSPRPSLRGEEWNVALLLLLYFLQGVPMGLAASVPLFLKQKVGLADVANFSLCAYPYSLKLLWAPIVDALFIPAFGRRKSWVVPVQLIVGVVMVALSFRIKGLLEADPPDIFWLTLDFFLLYFLVATQDIAVDGWALTMLRRENLGYASTCNAVGQQLGYVTSFASFLAFTSPDFCNRFRSVPSDEGIFTMEGFLMFWGFTFLVVTPFIAIFKKEGGPRHPGPSSAGTGDLTGVQMRRQERDARRPSSLEMALEEQDGSSSSGSGSDDDGDDFASESRALLSSSENDVDDAPAGWPAVKSAYIEMWRIIRLRNVATLALVLLTVRIAFMTEGAVQYELIDRGIAKEDIMLLGLPLAPYEMIITVAFSRVLAGPRPMTAYLWSFLGRLFGLLLFTAVFVFSTGTGAGYLLPSFFVVTLAFRIPCVVMFASQMAFFARVSDPTMGGTYMTLLNTVANLGGMWTSQVGLRAIAWYDESVCGLSSTGGEVTPDAIAAAVATCGSLDGFTVVTCASLVLGLAWWVLFRSHVLGMQMAKYHAWYGSTGPRWF